MLIDQASKICKIQPFLTTCLNSRFNQLTINDCYVSRHFLQNLCITFVNAFPGLGISDHLDLCVTNDFKISLSTGRQNCSLVYWNGVCSNCFYSFLHRWSRYLLNTIMLVNITEDTAVNLTIYLFKDRFDLVANIGIFCKSDAFLLFTNCNFWHANSRLNQD